MNVARKMTRWCALSAICVLVAAVANAAQDDNPPSPDAGSKYVTAAPNGTRIYNLNSPSRIPGKYLVVFKDARKLSDVGARTQGVLPDVLPTTEEGVKALAAAIAAPVRGSVNHVFNYANLRAFEVLDVSEADVLGALANDPRVDYVEAEIEFKPQATQSLPTDLSLWHLDRIDQRALPLNYAFDYDVDGSGVYVHVIDSGVRLTHEQFEGRAGSDLYWCPYLDFFGQVTAYGNNHECVRIDKQRFCTSWQPNTNICNENPPGFWESKLDCLDHGTRVASVIAGRDVGVAKQARIIPYSLYWGIGPGYPCSAPAASSVSGTTALIAALEEVLVQQRVGSGNVVNISLVAAGWSPSTEGVIEDVLNAGMTVVVAAGNANTDACTLTPARMSKTSAVITVGATSQTDSRLWVDASHGSNVGDCVTLFAPGDSLKTAFPAGDNLYAVNESGTSLAAAVVSGVAALYLSNHHGHFGGEVKNALVANATNGVLAPTNPNNGIGAGSPNKLVYSRYPNGDLPSLAVIQTILHIILDSP